MSINNYGCPRPLVYLAVPYSHLSLKIRRVRFILANQVAAKLRWCNNGKARQSKSIHLRKVLQEIVHY